MPVRSVIVPMWRFVLSEGLDILTNAEMLEHQKTLLACPRFDTAFNRLYNVSTLSDFQVSPSQMRAMPYPYAAGAIRAIVAENDMIYGMARMYQMLRDEEHQGALHVCRRLEEALEWIGLPRRDYDWVSSKLSDVEAGELLVVEGRPPGGP
ncbi:MAG: hypothetical protein AAF458_17800 [Pseudomonadota bacterium]